MKKLLSLLLSLVLALSLSATAFAAGPAFSDVPQNHWAYQYVERAADKGWVTGVGNGKFNPDGKVTGAEWYTMVARAFYGEQIPNRADAGKWYSNEWYGPYMQVGINNGFDDYFAADITKAVAERPLTRTEMACVVMQVVSQLNDDVYVQSSGIFYKTADIIPDLNTIPEGSGAYTAVVHSYAMGIITGVDSKGTFNGNGVMTRAQAAVVLGRMADVLETGEILDAPEQSTEPTVPEQSTEPTRPEAPGYEVVPGPTEEEAYKRLIALKADYPEGMRWTNDNRYPDNEYGSRGCAAFVLICQDTVFGDDLMGHSIYSFDELKVGDSVRIGTKTTPGGYHSVIVLEKKDNSIIVVEGNYNSTIHWGREITRDSLEDEGFNAYTYYDAWRWDS